MRHQPVVNQRRGQTLLEVVAATTILAMTLVPTLRMMRDSLRVGRETEMANHLATWASSKLEEYLVLTAATWSTTTATGNFGSEGYSNVRFQVTRSDQVSDGGIPGSLMALTCMAWEDRDGDSVWDSGEPRSMFSTKIARIAAYVYEAS